MTGTFVGLGGRTLTYCDHLYNAARTNERAVEVPIALDWIERHPGHGLEVGNVLTNYCPGAPWIVVDRDEQAPHVWNFDVSDLGRILGPAAPFDWIVSISTIEHVGWDDTPRDPDKALAAIAILRSLLAPTGRLLLSFPTGHHPGLDQAVADGTLDPVYSVLMARVDNPTARQPGIWEARPFRSVPYLHAAWSAGAVWIGEFAP